MLTPMRLCTGAAAAIRRAEKLATEAVAIGKALGQPLSDVFAIPLEQIREMRTASQPKD